MFLECGTSVRVENDMSFGELFELALQFSNQLQTVSQNGTVALCGLSNELTRLLVLGAWHSGWSVAMMPEHFTEAQKETALNTSEASVLVSELEAQSVTGSHLSMVIESDNPAYSFGAWLGTSQERIIATQGWSWGITDVALILFSSGSTGEPKGICHSVQNILISADRFIRHFCVSKTDVLLNGAEIHTMSGFRCSVILPILTACKVYDEPFNRDLGSVLNALSESQATIAIMGPSLIRQLAKLADKVTYLSTHLRVVLSTGARLTPEDKQRLATKAQIRVLDYYGLTETGGLVIGQSHCSADQTASALGKSCKGVVAKVLRPDGSEHKSGIGELRIYASGLFLGYTGSAQQVKSYFDTGDCVEINAKGDIYWLYRIQRGYKAASTEWVYPDLVESWLKNNTLVEDVEVEPIVDQAGRVRFLIRVSCDFSESFDSWCKNTNTELVAMLGLDYDILDWKLDSALARSALGKRISASNPLS